VACQKAKVDSQKANTTQKKANFTPKKANTTHPKANLTHPKANFTRKKANLTRKQASLTRKQASLTRKRPKVMRPGARGQKRLAGARRNASHLRTFPSLEAPSPPSGEAGWGGRASPSPHPTVSLRDPTPRQRGVFFPVGEGLN
jgi:hypothetical protein